MKQIALYIALGLAGPALAEGCPPVEDHNTSLELLITAAQEAETEAEGRALSDEMWALWTQAPDAHAQELLDEGMSRRESFDYAGALVAFEALVEYCPDYAEGYNQRAFAHFLREDFEAALPDLERTIELSPNHVAAMTGQALTLVQLGRNGEAALALRKALALNPWLSERHLLPSLEATESAL